MEQNVKKRNIMIFNIVMALVIFVFDLIYLNIGKLVMKGITSGLFFVLGLANFIFGIKNKNTNFKFSLFLLLGLLFAMLGDIVLNINFVAGAVLFGIGHILFFASYCWLNGLKWIDLVCGIVIFVPAMLFIVLSPLFSFEQPLMEVVCIVYAFVISFMLGKSVSNLVREHTVTNLTIFVGSLLFFFSDLMLLLNVFAGLGKAFDILCLITYYPAETLLAMSIWLSLTTNQKNKIQVNDDKKQS